LRNAVIVAAAILGFGAAAILIVLLATTGPGSPDASSRSLPEPPPAGPIPPLGGASGAYPTGAAQAVPVVVPQVVYAPADPRPPPGSWEAVKPVARPASLGPVGAAVGRELNELQPELSACFDEVSQARHGQARLTTTGAASSQEGSGPPTLMLLLEMKEGDVQIVDAPVETRGGASDGLIACAQGILRGRVVRVPGAKQVGRARLMFTLVE